MTVVFTLITLAVLGLIAAVAVGRIGGGLDDPASSLPSRGLPPGPVAGADLDEIRFSPALRGYRMDEVDAVLDRVRDELDRRDVEIGRLKAELSYYSPLRAEDGEGFEAPAYPEPPAYPQPAGFDPQELDAPARYDDATDVPDAAGDPIAAEDR